MLSPFATIKRRDREPNLNGGPGSVGMARQGYDLQLTRYDERGWAIDLALETIPDQRKESWR
jgi:hypothetical protein